MPITLPPKDREEFYDARSAFVDRYCASRAWDAHALKWEQIQEIRAQPEWAAPPAPREKEEVVVRRVGRDLFVCQEYEFCCVCRSTEWGDLRRLGLGNADSPLEFTVCITCHDGDAFREWLCGEFERAMIVHDENEKLPDGRWTTAKYGDRT